MSGDGDESLYPIAVLIDELRNEVTHELLRRTLGLCRKLVVPVKNPTRILIPHWEECTNMSWQNPTLSLRVLCGCFASSVQRTPSKNSQRKGPESVTTSWGHCSQWGMRFRVGFFTGTASFLRNPRVRRNSSHVYIFLVNWWPVEIFY